MKVLDAIKHVFDKILEVLGIICLSIMTVMIVYQVVARYVFNSPSAISEALAQFLFVWMIMFGSAYVYGTLEHLTIDILKDKFPPRMNMHISTAIMYASVPFTGVITMYYAIYNCVRSVRNYREGKRKLSDPLGGTA